MRTLFSFCFDFDVTPSFPPAGIRAGQLRRACARTRPLLMQFGGERRRGFAARAEHQSGDSAGQRLRATGVPSVNHSDAD